MQIWRLPKSVSKDSSLAIHNDKTVTAWVNWTLGQLSIPDIITSVELFASQELDFAFASYKVWTKKWHNNVAQKPKEGAEGHLALKTNAARQKWPVA